ncbi:hypothetical protein BH09BAC1_BH09BAC1_00300 [soil metagenome]
MKYLMLLVVFTLGMLTATAQLDNRLYGSASQIKNLTSRILLVELMEEDAKSVEKLQKNKKHPEYLTNYRNFITYYNATIQKLVKAHWRLNKQIEYKGTKEVETFAKAKSTKYVVLRFFVQEDKYGGSFSGIDDVGILKEGVTQADLKKDYATAELTDIDAISAAVAAGAEKTAYTVAMPFGIGGAGIVTLKVVVDAKSGDVLAITGLPKMGANIAILYWPIHVRQIAACEIK